MRSTAESHAATPAVAGVDRRPGNYIADSLRWLRVLRWWAISGVTVALLTAWSADLISTLVGPMLVVFALAALNIFGTRGKVLREAPDQGYLPSRAMISIHADLIALTLLLYFTGGVENPFSIFYVFHAAIAAIILPTPRPQIVAFSAALMYGWMVLGEWFGWLPHYRLGPPVVVVDAASPLFFVLGHLAAFVVSLFAVVYLVRTVVEQRRKSEALQRAHAKLAESRERLARIGEISAGLAHSIRNPLHGALNCLQILRDRPDDEDAVESLELLGEGLARIKDVTDRLAVLTRDAPVRRVPTDLSEAVDKAVRFLHVRFRDANMGVRTDLARTGDIYLDPDRFHEAFHNILDNAVAASQGHADQIDVVLKPAASGAGGGYCVTVRDQGPGISQADIERIFDPFYTTKEIGEGTGLGLAIAKKIMEAHGGSISVTSEPGVGTEVQLFFPEGNAVPTGAEES